jgi:hypothetical protein
MASLVSGRDRIFATLARIRELPAAAAACTALIACILLGLAGCDTAPAEDGAPFVLTTRGDFVRSSAPPGVEVRLGSKLIRPADAPDRLD